MTAGADPPAALASALAEYEALRAEIQWMVGHGLQLQNFALGLTAGVFPVTAYLIDNSLRSILIGLLLALPFALGLLGLLYFRQHQEVYVLAAYIREELRPQIREFSGDSRLWGWEEFKSARQKEISTGGPLGLWNPRTIVMGRLLIFVFPALVALVLSIAIALDVGWHELTSTYGAAGTVSLLLVIPLDASLLGILVFRFWTEGDLAKRHLGLP